MIDWTKPLVAGVGVPRVVAGASSDGTRYVLHADGERRWHGPDGALAGIYRPDDEYINKYRLRNVAAPETADEGFPREILHDERADDELADLRAEIARLNRQIEGHIKEHHGVEQALGKALGYPCADHTICAGCDPVTGCTCGNPQVIVAEHSPTSLAMEAAAALASMRAENERLRRLCGEVYQVVGALSTLLPSEEHEPTARALDNILAAASADPLPHDSLLPYSLPSGSSAASSDRSLLLGILNAARRRNMHDKPHLLFRAIRDADVALGYDGSGIPAEMDRCADVAWLLLPAEGDDAADRALWNRIHATVIRGIMPIARRPIDHGKIAVSLSNHICDLVEARRAKLAGTSPPSDAALAGTAPASDARTRALEEASRVVDHWPVATRFMPQWGIEKGYIVEAIRALIGDQPAVDHDAAADALSRLDAEIAARGVLETDTARMLIRETLEDEHGRTPAALKDAGR